MKKPEDIPAEALERIAPVLEALEAAFRPLAASLTEDVEPAVTFKAAEEDE